MRLHIAAPIIALALAGATFTSPAAAQADAPSAGDIGDSPAGHGSVSLTYDHYFENGVWVTAHTKVPYGTVHDQSIGFEGSYNVSDDWSVFGGIRYTNNVDHPIGKQEQTISAWQDISLGAAWHKHFGNYDFTPSVTANIPSHDYTVAGGGYTGQHLHQLLLAATLSHQFDFTNFYYKLGYGYAFSQKVLGFDTGYQRFDAELGWFVNDHFSVRSFATGRGGFGLTVAEVGRFVAAGNTELALQKTRVIEHSYRAWGLGADYDFGNHFVASIDAQHLYWGASVFNIDYDVQVRLTRNF
jgi:hypothetical protein